MKHNIDPAEIAQFHSLASDWWNPTGSMKLLHQLNPSRLNYIKKFLNLENKLVLDMGCGGGILTESLRKSGAITTGIDVTESLIQIAKQHAQQSQLTILYETVSAEDFSKQYSAQFDVITCMEMLEHVPNPASIIQVIATLMKPGGFVFFSTINRNLKSFLATIIGAEYVLNLLPKGTHHYEKFIKPSELTQWCESENFLLHDLQGIAYHPFSQTITLSDSVDINYLMCFMKK